MDRSDKITLIACTYEVDAIGQRVPVEHRADVYCNVRRVSMTEFFAAGKSGISPDYKVTVFDAEYEGEQIAEYRGVRYAIYRSYLGANETRELYLTRQEGVTHV